MEHLDAVTRHRVLEIINQGKDLTLATIRPDGYPQATTVCYASEELTLYAGIGLGSQKAANIQFNNKISATINLNYDDWSHIRGLSLTGTVEFVRGEEEIERIAKMLLDKFPQFSSISPGPGATPREGILFLRISPNFISLLDYRLGFGHTELYSVT
jgi:nitroimidazol reductase NimA-like FMN-containing flavoprotein (pyridoxamine 5'-phosphate oxidase superfamily)